MAGVKSTDNARTGLAREMLQVILGLEPNTLDRVMRLIKGSEDAADIRTMNMRKRLGARSMKYLRNAIDIARREGDEQHDRNDTTDSTKQVDLEPGGNKSVEQSKRADVKKSKDHEAEVVENMSFKDFLLNELNMDVDMSSPDATNDSIMKIKRAARMGTDRVAVMNVQAAKDGMKDAREGDPSDPSRQLDIKIAALQNQLAQLQKKKQVMSKRQTTNQERTGEVDVS